MTTFDVRHSAPVPSVGRRTADTVLVLRALGLGDALTGLPALRGARRLYPDRFHTMAVGPEIGGWLKGLGLIDEVLPTDRLADSGMAAVWVDRRRRSCCHRPARQGTAQSSNPGRHRSRRTDRFPLPARGSPRRAALATGGA